MMGEGKEVKEISKAEARKLLRKNIGWGFEVYRSRPAIIFSLGRRELVYFIPRETIEARGMKLSYGMVNYA